MTYYKCEKCETICDLIEVDDGNYEEMWGVKTWVPCIVKRSECCEEEVYETDDE